MTRLKKRSNRGVNPSKKPSPSLEAGPDDADSRQRLAKYLLGVIEDDKAPSKRRDEMAFCLSKMLSTTRGSKGIALPKPSKQKQPPKPRESTYVSKKREADVESRTAHKNSAWDGLINGSHRDDA